MNRGLSTILLIAALAALDCTQESRRTIESPAPPGPVACTEILMAGLVVEVRDAVTGEPAAFDAHGEIRDGMYVETLQLEGGRTVDPEVALKLVGAWERPGVYSVVVRKDGYRDWSSVAVVEADECHVHPITLQAVLEHQL